MGYFKGILSGLAAIILAELVGSWWFFGGISNTKPTGLAAVVGGLVENLFSPANGTAKALIASDKICETLASLDGALLTPRALGEFQGFRLQYHCRVPNFNLDAYPFP